MEDLFYFSLFSFPFVSRTMIEITFVTRGNENFSPVIEFPISKKFLLFRIFLGKKFNT